MTIEEYGKKDPLEKYYQWNSIDVNENANKYLGPSGFFSFLLEDYMKELVDIIPKSILKTHLNGYIYIHKLPYSIYIPYCTGHSISRLLEFGLKTPTISSKPAKHFDTYVDHIANYLITLQHYFTGAQALSSVEWYAGPFIKRDNLTIREVKQNIQRLLFNLNYPTRVGMQCLSEDSRILTPNGWKNYREIREGDYIYTFNLKTGRLELKPVKKIAIYHYKGIMYRLKSRNQDQLVSPKHRVVWLKPGENTISFNPIEELMNKLPITIPTTVFSENSIDNNKVSDNIVKLTAIYYSSGFTNSFKKGERVVEKIVFKQCSASSELKKILNDLGLEYRVRNCEREYYEYIELSSDSSKKFFELINLSNDREPAWIYSLGKKQAKLFINVYLENSGFIEYRNGSIYRYVLITKNSLVKDILIALAVLAGYNPVVKIKRIGRRKSIVYYIVLYENKYEVIRRIDEVEYSGIVWSVNTDNETVIAERNGTVFITGNTPFTNFTVTLDAPYKMLKKDYAIYSGVRDEPLETYYDEAREFFLALTKLYLEGDSIGQPFTFPIPTIMTTAKMIWEDPEIHEYVFKTSAIRGSFYWLNTRLVDPDASFAMCCRLTANRNDLVVANSSYILKRDLDEAREEFTRRIEKQRFGGVWAVPDITGSINVTTINLPRIVLESKGNDDKFWELYDSILEVVKSCEEWFRERYILLLSKYPGLYSMIKWYLREFPNTHFNTVGLIGLPEASAIYLQNPVLWKEGSRREWLRAVSIMNKMIEYAVSKAREWMVETGIPWNVEEVPGESAAAKLAVTDSKIYPELLSYMDNPDNPIYSSSIAPYYGSLELSDRIEIESMLQKKFTGGVMMHIFLDEEPDSEALAKLTKRLVDTDLVYWSYTPAITHCNTCGKTFTGLYIECPVCRSSNVDVWSRIVGYYRPIRNWNPQRRKEFWSRKHYRI